MIENALNSHFISPDISKDLHKIGLVVGWKHSYCIEREDGDAEVCVARVHRVNWSFQRALKYYEIKNGSSYMFSNLQPIHIPNDSK